MADPIRPYAGEPATALTSALLASNSGIQVDTNSIQLAASNNSAVNYYDGSLSPLGIGSGLLLTSGTAPGLTNTVGWFGTDNTAYAPDGTAINYNNGDPAIDAVVNSVFQTQSYDATTLSFNFTVTNPNAVSISFDVVFGSEEYPEWVDQFVDCAVVIVNGVNYAYFNHDPNAPLSVISPNLAAGYFQDNAGNVLPVEYDGVSHVLKIVAPIIPGQVNSIKIGIADTGDHIYDSGIFISNLSAGTVPGSGVVITPDIPCTDADDTMLGSVKDELIDLKGGNDIAYAGAGDDIVIGGAGNDAIYGGSGNDVLEGDSGDDLLDGGEGLGNIAVYSGLHSSVTIKADPTNSGFQLVSASEGTDTLHNIQILKFSDGLFDLQSNGQLVAHSDGSVVPTNTPGLVVISGIAIAGNSLTALVIDADGVPTSDQISFQWQSSADGVTWTPISGATGKSYVTNGDEAGLQISVDVTYTDGQQNPESLHAPALQITKPTTSVLIELMMLDAPLGASVMTPITTLMSQAMLLGYSANEASVLIKQGLGLSSSLDLAHFDPIAILAHTPTNSAALQYLKVATEVAMTASVSDPSGLNLALAVLDSASANTTLNLANKQVLSTLLVGVPSATIDMVQNLNSDMAGVSSYSGIKSVWLDYCGKQDQLWSYHDHIDVLSVHINQAPIGTPTAILSSGAVDTDYVITEADLLAGLSDPEGSPLSIVYAGIDQGGTLSQSLDGSWIFTPDTGFTGPVQITYIVSDPLGLTLQSQQIFAIQSAPTAPTVTLLGVASQGETLSVDLSALQGVDGINTAVIDWYENGQWVATSPTYLLSQGDVDTSLYAIVTYSDSSSAVHTFQTDTSAPVANINDLPTGAPLITGAALTGSTLGVDTSSIADLDGLGTFSYAWFKNGTTLVGTNSTYVVAATDENATLTVELTYTDGFGTVEWLSSLPTETILNASSGLIGSAQADTLIGTSGNDVLIGRGGQDVLDGRGGSDLYVMMTANDHLAAEMNDTGTGTGDIDEVRYAGTSDATLKLFAGDTGIELVTIGTGTGTVADTTGTAAINIDASAVLTKLTINGNAGNNYLVGGAGNDTINGGNGNDIVDGYSGNDILNGAGGIDSLSYASAASGVTINLSLTTAQVTGGAGTDTISNFENLIGSDFADNLTGTSGANVLFGAAGNDILNGGLGNDVLDGGEGSDLYIIATTADHPVAEIADSGTGVSDVDELRFTATTASTLTLYSGDVGLERIVIGTGTAASAVVTGTTAINVNAAALTSGVTIIGNAGANSLTGGSGDDVLNGGAGADTLVGGLGNDLYIVDATGDIVTELADQGIDQVQSAITYTLGANVEQLLLTGTTAINGTGNGLDNVIIGNSGNNILTGGLGADALDGGAGTDTASYAAATAGIAVSLMTGLGTAGEATGDVLVNIENITGSAYDDVIEGNAGNNVLAGGTGTDTLSYANAAAGITISLATTTAQNTGGAGSDTISAFENLIGSGFADTLTGTTTANVIFGGAGNDILTGGGGADALDGGAGSDLYIIATVADHPSAEIADSGTGPGEIDELRYTGTSAGTLTLYAGDTGLERIVIGTGTGASAVATGTTAINVNGAALLNGVTISGNAGANALTGGAGDDLLDGAAGNDTLNGGAGNDTLLGGLGNDSLTGGTGADLFLFNATLNATTNKDTITDFTHADGDRIGLSKTIFTALADAIGSPLISSEFYAAAGATTAHAAQDRIIYNTTTGALYYDADGNGSTAAIQIALLGASTHPTLVAEDFVVMG